MLEVSGGAPTFWVCAWTVTGATERAATIMACLSMAFSPLVDRIIRRTGRTATSLTEPGTKRIFAGNERRTLGPLLPGLRGRDLSIDAVGSVPRPFLVEPRRPR